MGDIIVQKYGGSSVATTEKITKRFDSVNNVKIETDNIKSIED